MPCSDGYEVRRLSSDNVHMIKGGDLLCEYLRYLEARELEIPKGFHLWWAEHLARDADKAKHKWEPQP